ncbi:MAG: NAD-dependent epimerase/dehydratase family protein [Planctomycetota bacterium]
MRILYIGGTGDISFDCVHASVAAGHEVYVFNRGNRNAGLPPAARLIRGDVFDDAEYGRLADEKFDVVCQFRLFDTHALERDLRFFTGHCGRYVFVSTASAYRKPLPHWRVTEDVSLHNPYWEYSRKKADMEALLFGQDDLPFVIVRPSHTYRTGLPVTAVERQLNVSRLLRGKPVVQHGDGTSLWTLTHARDFAPAFVRLVTADAALGDAFHITSEDPHPWDTITRTAAAVMGVDDPRIVHVPTRTLTRYHPEWEGPLLGDKAQSVFFDNAKLRSVIGPFACPTTIEEGFALSWAEYPVSADLPYDETMDALMDRIVAEQEALGVAG